MRFLLQTTALLFLVAAAPNQSSQQIIQGRLVEDQTNKPIEGASISLLAANGRPLDRVAISNKHGTFTMRVEEGRYKLSIKRIAFQAVESEIVEVARGKSVTVNYILTPVTVRLARIVTTDQSGLETGRIGMAKREALKTGGVFLYSKDFAEIKNQPVWEIVGRVEGMRARLDGSIESLEGNRCVQFLLNRLPIREIPMQFVDITTQMGQNFASVYEMLPDGLDIAGIEVYRKFNEVPPELRFDAWPEDVNQRGVTPPRVLGSVRKAPALQACGLVVFWTSAAW